MKPNKTSIWIPLLAWASLATLAAASASADAGRGRPGLRHLEHRIDALELDPGVRDQALAIVGEAREGERALHDQMQEAHAQLRELLESDAPDGTAIDTQVEALGALRTRTQKQFFSTLLRVAALLDDSQRAAFLAPPDRGGPRGHCSQ